MPSTALRFSYNPVSLGVGLVAVLTMIYIALIAVTVSYAALTVESAQSVRNEEAVVASLESRYLAAIAEVTAADYHALGYVKPGEKTFVATKSGTALR